ncbi:MAG: non-canonical purine NTP pyrophosphatase [Aurantimicrobium sp.]
MILNECHGDGGFGYDPVFIPESFEVTAAILDPAEKNKLSHRSRALQALADRLSS